MYSPGKALALTDTSISATGSANWVKAGAVIVAILPLPVTVIDLTLFMLERSSDVKEAFPETVIVVASSPFRCA